MSERKYQPPSWAAPPTAEFFLEVMKNGVIVGTVDLSKRDHYLFGRQPDVVDVPLEHETISRQHAAIQFRDDGAMLLYDLGSVHGTFVNKQPVVQKVYHRLNVGDMIRFGASSRTYIVNGPEELLPEEHDSQNLRKYRDALKERSAKAAAVQDEGVSWGMDEDATPVEEQDEGADTDDIPFEQLPDYLKNDPRYRDKYDEEGRPKKVVLKDVHEKDAKLVEKLRQKEKKIENLEAEIHRIRAKDLAQGGLSEGQQHAIYRNEQQIQKLRDEIDQLQYEIELQSQQRDEAERRARGEGGSRRLKVTHEDETDEFYDRTALNADESNWRIRKKRQRQPAKPTEAEGESMPTNYKSLEARRRTLEEEAQEIRQRMEAVEAVAQESVQAAPESGDALDAYMASNEVRDHQQELEALRKRLQEIEKELVTVSKLAEFVKPALPELLPPVPAPSSQEAKDKFEPVKLPLQQQQPARQHPVHVAEPFVPEEESDDEEEQQKALEEAKKALEEEQQEDKEEEQPSGVSVDDEDNRKRLKQEEQGEERQEQQQQQQRAQPQPKRKVYGPTMPQRNQRPKMATPATGFDEDVLQDGEVAWVPPKGQTGDGRTALNDKLGY